VKIVAIYAVLLLVVLPGPLLLLGAYLRSRRSSRRVEPLEVLPGLFGPPPLDGSHETIPGLSAAERADIADRCERMWTLPEIKAEEGNRS
jgi:hypothetical protein